MHEIHIESILESSSNIHMIYGMEANALSNKHLSRHTDIKQNVIQTND